MPSTSIIIILLTLLSFTYTYLSHTLYPTHYILGVRLGWTVVPSELKYSDGSPVRNDWNRVMTTAFNGASNVAQYGGLACLDDAGLAEIDRLIDYYLENARLLRETFVGLGYKVYGGVDAPYIFVDMGGPGSW